MNQQTVP